MDKLLLLDKSWLLGASEQRLYTVALSYRLGFAHELFFELLTGPDVEAVRCLRKLKMVQDRVVVLPGIGVLWRSELDTGKPVLRLEGHAVRTQAPFRIPEQDGRLNLAPQQRAAIESELSDRQRDGLPLTQALFANLAVIFPDLAAIAGKSRALLEPFEQTVAEGQVALDLLHMLDIPADRTWFAFTRVQALMLGGLEYVRAHGPEVLTAPAAKLPNAISDLEHASLAAKADGIATRDKQLARIVRLLRPDSITED